MPVSEHLAGCGRLGCEKVVRDCKGCSGSLGTVHHQRDGVQHSEALFLKLLMVDGAVTVSDAKAVAADSAIRSCEQGSGQCDGGRGFGRHHRADDGLPGARRNQGKAQDPGSIGDNQRQIGKALDLVGQKDSAISAI